MNAMKYVANTLNFDFFRGRGVNQDKRERMVVLVPKFLSLNYSVKLGPKKKRKKKKKKRKTTITVGLGTPDRTW